MICHWRWLVVLALLLGAGPARAQAVSVEELTATAEAGDVAAQTRLANWYAHGIKVEKSYRTARRWYEMAARRGDALAAYELGLLYEFGRGVLQDNALAAYWFQQGAKGGHGPSTEKFARYERYLPAAPPPATATMEAQGRPAGASGESRTTLPMPAEKPREAAMGVSRPSAASSPAQALEAGRFHALIIGNNDYPAFKDLHTAVPDAIAVANLLREAYHYEIHLLLNATRYDVLKKLTELRHTLKAEDNLLLYYAGHGIVDRDTDRGYWLPVDADPEVRANWLSNTDITDMLKAMEAWHVLVVADSCYSGALVRSVDPITPAVARQAHYFQRLLDKRSRTVLSSGGLEPVLDGGGGQHSVFTKAFLDVLEENPDVLEGSALFSLVRRKVALNAEQTPEYADIRFAGHDGGDFLFIRK